MERDLAHEHDMEMLRREQLRADIGDDDVHFDDVGDEYWEPVSSTDEMMGDPDEWDFEESY